MSWNKGRLAYTPLGPYVAKQYEEGLSYGKIAEEIGIHRSCVQNLCKAIGVQPRENHTTNIASVWEQRLKDYIKRTNITILERPVRLSKKSRIVTECAHGVSNRPCQILESLQFCCRIGAKEGENNPLYGKSSWNAGRTDLSGILTGRPEGSKNKEEVSEEARRKYSEARKRITENGQPWSGFQRPIDEERDDYLYLIALTSGEIKVGRSYLGAQYRKKETFAVLGEWKSISKYVWEAERLVLSKYAEFKSPLTEKSNGRGLTERFRPDLPIEEVINFISEFFKPLSK